jgi:hypothetical protein
MRRAATGLMAVGAVALTACGGGDGEGTGGVIEENVVRPGITAIDDASALSCDADVRALDAALQSYEMLEGSPAPDEQALVDAGYLRSPSDLVDVVGGLIVAQDPGCAAAVPAAPIATAPSGSAPLTAPATDVGEIVTSVAPLQATTDQVLATMSEIDIDSYGGIDCATEIAAISAAGQAFVAREGRNPDSLDDLADDLDRAIALWAFDADRQSLVPAEGSPCPDAFAG